MASLALCGTALAADTISVSGFSNCKTGDSTITVQKLDISFDRATNTIVFDVQGTSAKSQEITAKLDVEVYGFKIPTQSFDPCAEGTKVDQLCPVPEGTFGAKGSQQIPTEYVSQIPSIVYSLPDLDGAAQMVLTAKDGSEAACITSTVTNGKSVELGAVTAVAGVIAAGALVASAASAAMAGGKPGVAQSSPGFFEVMWWFQGIAMDGMYTVNYPGIYRSFTKNFGFSTGLIPWGAMQTSIDNFRSSTGGNTTVNSYAHLKNSTLHFDDGTTSTPSGSFRRLAIRALDTMIPRQIDGITTSINDTSSGGSSSGNSYEDSEIVQGIQAYVTQLTIPDTNAFMTILLVFAVVLAAIVVGILLFKVILEAWSLFGKYPKSLVTFRKEYWRILAQTITGLIFLLYGVWTLYCIYQFRNGDSWAARALAGVTLLLFTALLGFYCWKIHSIAKKFKKASGNSSGLYEDKETWKKYKLFYENYKKQYWWIFMPFIVYMFAKGCVLAGGDGHGMVQTIGQLIIEVAMLVLLLWNRPFDRKSGNWINIVIQVVRVLSVGCILVFVEELGVPKTAQTVTGIVLIVVQASLTAILAILIGVNAIINCCKENPHRKRRKAAEKAQSRDLEGDAFLMDVRDKKNVQSHTKDLSDSSMKSYDDMRAQAQNHRGSRYGLARGESQDPLVKGAQVSRNGQYHSVSQDMSHDVSPPSYVGREPRLPDLDYQGGGVGQPGRVY